MNDTGTSYLLWIGWFFGASGLHRLYNRKFASGFLWLCTWGLFGVGQFVDLFLIPGMVEEHNLKAKARQGLSPAGVPLASAIAATAPQLTREQLMIKLVKAAHARNGKLSVTQAVMDTGVGFPEVEAALKSMLKAGYIGIDNHPETGAVQYIFHEL